MITRTYQCVDCDQYFEVDHESGEEPEPPCPHCDVVLEWRPKSFAIGTNKGRAVDIAQKIIEQDYGITNMKDSTREGETVLIEPRRRARNAMRARQIGAEIRAFAAATPEPGNPALQAQIKQFFGGGAAGSSIDINQALAASKTGPGAYTKDNNPMSMLHQSGKAGLLPNNMRVIAKA